MIVCSEKSVSLHAADLIVRPQSESRWDRTLTKSIYALGPVSCDGANEATVAVSFARLSQVPVPPSRLLVFSRRIHHLIHFNRHHSKLQGLRNRSQVYIRSSLITMRLMRNHLQHCVPRYKSCVRGPYTGYSKVCVWLTRVINKT